MDNNDPAKKLQIHLVRLLHFPKLDKVIQVWFAEYHSKRKQAHLVVIHALQKQAIAGPEEHTENIESGSTGSTRILKEVLRSVTKPVDARKINSSVINLNFLVYQLFQRFQ